MNTSVWEVNETALRVWAPTNRKEHKVHKLISTAASALEPNGHFVITFRDYSSALAAQERFIPVRSDESRILTCFLEYADSHLTVHDLLHELTCPPLPVQS
jgi:hypothetical protein